jgi:hypothetical protein
VGLRNGEHVPRNLDRLKNTLVLAHQIWQAEERCQSRNATNESAWSVQVIEPVLAALDWRRLRQGDTKGTGAYYEWPGKNSVDVALLVNGEPKAYLELKKHRTSCRMDYMRARLDKHPGLRNARLAVAAWHEHAGFDVYNVNPDATLTVQPMESLAAATQDLRPLAQLAYGVLANEVADVDAWLALPVPDANAVGSRFRPRDVQARFFELLREKLKLDEPLSPRHRCLIPHPPTPTYAFTELPSVLPKGWGLVFGIDPTINDIQCSFFRNSNTELENVGRWRIDDGLDDRVMERFLDERILPRIQMWREEALRLGLLQAKGNH